MLFVPCQQDVSSVGFSACTISVRAYPMALEHAGFRCAGALRCDGRRASNWFARASFTSAAESGQCVLLQSVCNSACTVEGRIATRTASVHERAAQIRIARRASHACSSSCTSGVTNHYIRGVTADGSWCTSGGISLRPLTLRCVCNSACDDRVAARVCMPMQSKTRGNHRSVSASGGTMHCGGRS